MQQLLALTALREDGSTNPAEEMTAFFPGTRIMFFHSTPCISYRTQSLQRPRAVSNTVLPPTPTLGGRDRKKSKAAATSRAGAGTGAGSAAPAGGRGIGAATAGLAASGAATTAGTLEPHSSQVLVRAFAKLSYPRVMKRACRIQCTLECRNVHSVSQHLCQRNESKSNNTYVILPTFATLVSSGRTITGRGAGWAWQGS